MDLTFETIPEICRQHVGAAPAPDGVRRIPTGKFNDTFDVALSDGHVMVRVAPPETETLCFYERRMMRQEPDIHAMLLERTSVPVPRVLAADFSHTIIDRDFLIMERLPGRPLTEARDISAGTFGRILRKTGEYLREAHDITADRHGYLGAHRPMEPCETWPQAFEEMWNRLIDDVVAVEGYAPAEARFMRDLRAAHEGHFRHEVVSRFLHMDIWHQNILIDDRGEVTGILDWDRALWGDPEIEFAVLDYCGISEPPFWEGYARQRPSDGSAAIRQALYLLYEMQKYIVIRKGRNNRPAEAMAHKQRCLALARRLAG